MTVIRLQNTKTRRKEVFEPIDPKNVRMYLCGPTVYDRAHLGNARNVLMFDVLFRLFREFYGEDHVTYVRNFTDVDDKINARAAATGRSIREITDETIGWYHADMDALGALRPNHEPRATEYIAEMVAMIEDLIAKGHAYEAEGHVLFAVSTDPEYGSLSGRSVDDMIAGARVEVAPYKRDPMDFVLWKPSDSETPGWESPWGRGRPGWHIECSAMSKELLGTTFDIHGGGNDLQFPHHENEVAQSRCAHPDAEFAKVWLHNDMLQVEGKKMSKSLGNFFTVRDLLDQGVPGEVIRFVFLSTHYGKPMDWNEKKRQEAEKTLRKYAQLFAADPLAKPRSGNIVGPLPEEFIDAIANDLNTSLALTLLNKYYKAGEESKLRGALVLLGFDPTTLIEKFAQFEAYSNKNEFVSGSGLSTFGGKLNTVEADLSALSEKLRSLREEAMKTKDFAQVDALKSALLGAGVEVQMSKDQVSLKPTPDFDPSKLEGLK